MMAWVDAVRKYAEMKGQKWRIPKKGTPEYAEIKALQAGKSKKKAIRVVESLEAPKKERKVMKEKKKEEVMEAPKKMRKTRSDKGQKRMTGKMIAKESVRLGLVSKAEALGRKVRSDKGKKRGARKPKAEKKEEMKEEEEYFAYA